MSKGRGTTDPETGLTAIQERFCAEFAKTGNASDAYRKAYCSERMKPATINRCAFDLTQNPKVAARLEQIRAAARERSEVTLEGHLKDLKSLRNAAAQQSQFGAAISAEIARGKASGLYDGKDEGSDTPAPVNVTVNVVDGRKSA